MIKETGYEGLFDVEFLEDINGKLYFMEMNFRVDGGIYKVTPGVNLPKEWCRLVNVDKDDLPEALTTKKARFTGMTEVQDFMPSYRFKPQVIDILPTTERGENGFGSSVLPINTCC